MANGVGGEASRYKNIEERGKITDRCEQCVISGDKQAVNGVSSQWNQFSQISVDCKQSTLKASSVSEFVLSAENTMRTQDGSRCVIPL